MRNFKISNVYRCFLLVVVLFCSGMGQLQAANSDPKTEVNAVVSQLITQVTDKLAPHKGKLKENSPIVKEVMITVLIPQVNFEAMSGRILQNYWRNATPEQKQIFIQQFRSLLIKTYSKLFENYNGQQIAVRARLTRLSPDQQRAEVKTVIKSNDRPEIHVTLRLIKTEQWQVYDLVIDGISLVKNYQAQLMPFLKRDGLNAAIAKLKQNNFRN